MKKKGLIKATIAIVKDDGIRVLLSGLGPTTVGFLLEGAVKFGVYEALKLPVQRFLLLLLKSRTIITTAPTALVYTVCGSVAGLAASVLLCPMEALRIRLVAEPDFGRRGWIHGGASMLKQDGLFLSKQGGPGLLAKGLPAMVSKQVPYTVTKQVSFDMLVTAAYTSLCNAGRIPTAQTKVFAPLGRPSWRAC